MVATLSACGQSDASDPDWVAAREIYATCAACHGKGGEGGVGPALATVRETFPDCEEHKKWIALGSARWKEEVGPSYGASGKTIEGAMPAFDSMSATALSQIAVYERVRFGGGGLDAERAACGLPGP